MNTPPKASRERTPEAVLQFLRGVGGWVDLHTLRREVWGTGDGKTPRLSQAVNSLLAEGALESRGGLDSGRTFMVRAVAPASSTSPKEPS